MDFQGRDAYSEEEPLGDGAGPVEVIKGALRREVVEQVPLLEIDATVIVAKRGVKHDQTINQLGSLRGVITIGVVGAEQPVSVAVKEHIGHTPLFFGGHVVLQACLEDCGFAGCE